MQGFLAGREIRASVAVRTHGGGGEGTTSVGVCAKLGAALGCGFGRWGAEAPCERRTIRPELLRMAQYRRGVTGPHW